MIEKTIFKDVFILSPRVFLDERGFFYEFYNQKKFNKLTGLDVQFIQDNLAKSDKNVLRGLHFQKGKFAQAKLVSVIKGKVLDVIVDLRPHSKTFGKHLSIILSDSNKKQIFIPRGFAHGYLTLEKNTLFFYKIDNEYNKESESGIYFNDPYLKIDWKVDVKNLILSEKDKKLPKFKELF